MKMLASALQKLPMDKSLIEAMEPAFAKKPAERGPFDETVITQIRDGLESKLQQLEEELSNGESLKAQKQSEQGEAAEALKAAEEVCTQSQQALCAAEEKRSALET